MGKRKPFKPTKAYGPKVYRVFIRETPDAPKRLFGIVEYNSLENVYQHLEKAFPNGRITKEPIQRRN